MRIIIIIGMLLISINGFSQVYPDEIERSNESYSLLVSDSLDVYKHAKLEIRNDSLCVVSDSCLLHLDILGSISDSIVGMITDVNITFEYIGGSWAMTLTDQNGNPLDSEVMTGVINFFSIDNDGNGVTASFITSDASYEIPLKDGNGVDVYKDGSDIKFRVDTSIIATQYDLTQLPEIDTIWQRNGSDIYYDDGDVLIGDSVSQTMAGANFAFQVMGTGYDDSGVSTVRYSNNVGGANVIIGKSRSSTIGGNGQLVDGDNVGGFFFVGDDGSDMNQSIAVVKAQVDGTTGTDDLGGKLIFMTTPDGSNSPVDRMIIDNAGNVTVSTLTNGIVHANGSGVLSELVVGDNLTLSNDTLSGTAEPFDSTFIYQALVDTATNIRSDFPTFTPFDSTYIYAALADSMALDLDRDPTNEIQDTSEIDGLLTYIQNHSIDSYTETDPIFNTWGYEYDSLINTPTIPTLTSQLTNDVPFLITEVDGDTLNEGQMDFVDLGSGTFRYGSNTPYSDYLIFDNGFNSTNATWSKTGNILGLDIDKDLSNYDNGTSGFLTSFTETDPIYSAWDKDYNDLINTPSSIWALSGTSAYYNDGNVGIGVTSPSVKLQVAGRIQLDNSTGVYLRGNSDSHIGIGQDALSTELGLYNIGIGKETGNLLTSTALYNILIGRRSGNNITTSDKVVGIGVESAQYAGTNSFGLGYQALRYPTGANNVAIGGNAFTGVASGTGANNIAIGGQSLFYNNTGNDNVAIGYQSGLNATGTGNVFIGNKSGYNETGSNKLYIDNSTISDPLIWGDFSTNVVNINGELGIGTTTPATKLHVTRSTAGEIARFEMTAASGGGNFTVKTTGASAFPLIQLVTAKGSGLTWNIENSRLTSNDLGFYQSGGTSGTKMMIQQNTGNVGINTTSPSEKLDVVGNAEINGYLTVTDNLEGNAVNIGGWDSNNRATRVSVGSGIDLTTGTLSVPSAVQTLGSATMNTASINNTYHTSTYYNLSIATERHDNGNISVNTGTYEMEISETAYYNVTLEGAIDTDGSDDEIDIFIKKSGTSTYTLIGTLHPQNAFERDFSISRSVYLSDGDDYILSAKHTVSGQGTITMIDLVWDIQKI